MDREERKQCTRMLMYSSESSHWDFDVPARIAGLPFLNKQAKRNILAENARRLFRP